MRMRALLLWFLPALMQALLLPAACGRAAVPTLGHRDQAAKQAPPGDRPYIVGDRVYYPLPSAEGYVEEGVASWYGPGFHGRRTSSGEIYDMNAMTAAHRTLPMGTMLLVRNLENGREAVVRINDRGPFAKARILDLSLAAARRLGIYRRGTGRVRIAALGETRTGRDGQGRVRRVFARHPDFYKGEFYVQVGAFVNQDNARRLARRLRRDGSRVEVRRFQAPDGRTFHRVQVHAGGSLREARRRMAALVRAGFTEAFVVAK